MKKLIKERDNIITSERKGYFWYLLDKKFNSRFNFPMAYEE